MKLMRYFLTTVLILIVCILQMGFTAKKIKYAATRYYIVVDKSENTLTVYDPQDWVVQFPVRLAAPISAIK